MEVFLPLFTAFVLLSVLLLPFIVLWRLSVRQEEREANQLLADIEARPIGELAAKLKGLKLYQTRNRTLRAAIEKAVACGRADVVDLLLEPNPCPLTPGQRYARWVMALPKSGMAGLLADICFRRYLAVAVLRMKGAPVEGPFVPYQDLSETEKRALRERARKMP